MTHCHHNPFKKQVFYGRAIFNLLLELLTTLLRVFTPFLELQNSKKI